MRTRNQPNRADAFTLQELLVVLTVIVLLTAILLPAVHAVRDQAKQVACAAALRATGGNVALYAASHRQELPTHFRNPKGCSFDTFWLDVRGERVNLGLLQGFAGEGGLYYCPDQPSNAIAFDSQVNLWGGNDAPPTLGPGPGGSTGNGAGPGPGGPGGGATTAPGEGCGLNVCASFTARVHPPPKPPAPRWRLMHYANRVIYTDFIGVDGYTGGRFEDLRAAHGNRGANRLFGDGSVQWAEIAGLEGLRPVTDEQPTYEQLHAYFERLDVLP